MRLEIGIRIRIIGHKRKRFVLTFMMDAMGRGFVGIMLGLCKLLNSMKKVLCFLQREFSDHFKVIPCSIQTSVDCCVEIGVF